MSKQKTHWKKLGDPRFLGEHNMFNGEELTLTITKIENEEAFNPKTSKMSVVRSSHFKEIKEMMVLNTTNCKTLAKLYKSNAIEDWVGKKIVVFFDKTVKVGRELVGGVRIRPIIPAPQKVSLKCGVCGEQVQGYDQYTAEQIAKHTYQKYGKELCSSCAEKEKQRLEEENKTSTEKLMDILEEDNEV